MKGMDAPAIDGVGWLRRIGLVSTTRADAGIYGPLVEALCDRSPYEVVLFAGGTHLSERFGRTIEHLPRYGRLKVVSVVHQMEGDRPVDVAASAARAGEAFSRSFAAEEPDLLFVLGDRAEMAAAAMAATIHRIPMAHLHGGETTAGAYDDAFRNAITKLAHVHFAALREYGERIAAMGEPAWRVHVVGAPALDRLRGFEPEPVAELSAAVGLDFREPTVLVVFHVETMAVKAAGEQVEAVLSALGGVEANLLFVGSNADVGHGSVESSVRRFVEKHRRARLVPSLPPERFWSCMARATAMVGNSSAGIIEAPSFGLPVVNIGDRQKGRTRTANVIDVANDLASISGALKQALSVEFRKSVANMRNPYGDGDACSRILRVISSLPTRNELLLK